MTEKKFEKANMQGGQDAEEQARRFLLAGQMKRTRAAQKEVEAIYAKYKVGLDVYMIVRPSGTIVRAQIVPQEGWAGDLAELSK